MAGGDVHGSHSQTLRSTSNVAGVQEGRLAQQTIRRQSSQDRKTQLTPAPGLTADARAISGLTRELAAHPRGNISEGGNGPPCHGPGPTPPPETHGSLAEGQWKGVERLSLFTEIH